MYIVAEAMSAGLDPRFLSLGIRLAIDRLNPQVSSDTNDDDVMTGEFSQSMVDLVDELGK